MIWDTTTKQYNEGAKMATGRSDACGAAVNGKLYVAGGWTTNFDSILQSVEVFDPETGAWSAGPPLPEPRCAYTLLDSAQPCPDSYGVCMLSRSLPMLTALSAWHCGPPHSLDVPAGVTALQLHRTGCCTLREGTTIRPTRGRQTPYSRRCTL